MTALSALPAHPHPWSALLERDDIVVSRGMLHLRHDATTPGDATIDDLLLVADALDGANVPHLLIRHDRSTPALVVSLADRDRALAALAGRADGEPLYAKPKGGQTVPMAELVMTAPGPSALRVFRPRISATGTLRYGAGDAARVEFWRFGEELVEAPYANTLTRRAFATEDLEEATVARFGRTWRTLSGMFDAHPAEFTEDVDMVFSWVDGSSTEFQRQRAAQISSYVVGDGDDGPARFRHVDELRYALRSVHMYAPWVRRIFIVTDSPRPAWLVDHPKVTIVRSEEFFADPSVLPTHNSHAVEAQLHRIEGLAEHFLYSNDDMFFGRPLSPELFFSPAGISSFVECDVRIGTGPARLARSGHDNALRVNRELLRKRFGRTIVRDLEHCAAPLRRSILTELEQEFPAEIARTAAARFRSATDVSVTNCLYHYYAQFTGRAVASTAPRVRYYQTTSTASLRQMERLARRSDIDMFCLNDGGFAEVPEPVRVRAVTSLLEGLFPVRPPWEDDAVSAAPAQIRSEELPALG
ncbi:stealth conserved region 3 domain-containing protein [Microbacterium invictum]|uniref:Exopolysaccharide phosphotransferase CpsY n=1 Tax=Microbacterium invictum TaxID=515415 RepID=A0AA40SM55_9MICO|nr:MULTISPECIES: stealth conserved region 3 domain-containing protein [Microbacterium]MBB4138645.1 hypothetical protein [Microbacterium invictum]